jgi:ribosomal protein S18 acetylase RimI-like enzyme
VLNTVVGFLTLQRHFNHAAEITWMAVHASHRHHGVGRGRSSSGSAKT